MKSLFITLVAAALLVTTFGVNAAQAEKKKLLAAAPQKYVAMPNPVAQDAEAFEIGRRIYTLKCAKCHELDDHGERQGPDLAADEVKQAAPGTLYWVLEKGSGDMPSFAKYPDKYRWQLVTYLQKR